MWALIMTCHITGSHINGFSMATIQGFKTEQACRMAGGQQEVALRNDLKIDTSKKYTFICVKGE